MNHEALYRISYGMYIVSSYRDKKFNGQIANAVFQVTSNPVMVAVCINKKNLTHEFIEESGAFSISILEKNTPMKFIGRFGFRSGRNFDKFHEMDYFVGKTGAPVVREHAVAYVEAELVDRMDVGTHTLFIGEVVDGEVFKDAEVLTYSYYHYVLKGKAPKTATIYFEKQ